MTRTEFSRHLQNACEQVGGHTAFARRHGLSQSFVSDVVRGAREPGARLLQALDMRKVVVFESIHQGDTGE